MTHIKHDADYAELNKWLDDKDFDELVVISDRIGLEIAEDQLEVSENLLSLVSLENLYEE